MNCSPWQHNAPHQHPFHTHLHLLHQHRHDTRMDTVFGHYCWTCNIQTTRSYRTFGLSNSDTGLIQNTPYKTPHRMNCMYRHYRLNTKMLSHTLPYVRPYTDRQHRLIELNCSPWQHNAPHQHPFRTHLCLQPRHHHGIRMDTVSGHCYWTCNIPQIQFCTMFDRPRFDTATIRCTPYVHQTCSNSRHHIVIDRFWLLMFHQLNNIHWTQYNEHRHCNNSCFHRTRIVPYALLTFRQWNNIQPLPYCAPVHWTIR